MAKPIKETPILKGKDAAEFTKRLNNVAKVSPQEKARIEENYQDLLSRLKDERRDS